jgi:integrase
LKLISTRSLALRRKASTAALYEHYLKKLAVTHADVLKLHASIGKMRQVTANRVVAALSGMFAYAAKIGHVEPGFNPAKGVEDFEEKPKQRYLSTPELARLGDTLHQAETIGLPWSLNGETAKSKHLAKEENRRTTIDAYAIAAIRLLLLTGARLREILHARWDWYDSERGLLILPDSKTGGKSLYLSAAAIAVLESLPKIAGNPFIFPGEAVDESGVGRPRAGLKRPWQSILKAAEIEGVRLHDLRHTFAAYGRGAPRFVRDWRSSWTCPTRDDAKIRPPRRGPDAPRRQHDRQNHQRRDEQEAERRHCPDQAPPGEMLRASARASQASPCARSLLSLEFVGDAEIKAPRRKDAEF